MALEKSLVERTFRRAFTSPKQCIQFVGLGALLFSPLACILLVMLGKQLQSPEADAARRYLQESEVLRARFGRMDEVRLKPWFGRNSNIGVAEGFYTFAIEGDRNSGVVRVYWKSTGNGIGFEVKRVELLGPGLAVKQVLVRPGEAD